MFYLNFAPDDCFAACGFYHPEPSVLDAIRKGIAAHPDRFHQRVAALTAAGLTLSTDNALKRAPRGYENVEDPDIAAALKLKSFVTLLPLSQHDVASASLVAKLSRYARSASVILELLE